MKKYSIFIIAIFALGFLSNGYAQGLEAKKIAGKDGAAPKISDLALFATVSAMEELKNESPKVYKDFSRHNKNVADLRIHKENDYTFLYFIADDIKTRSAYNKKGRWMHTIRYYAENKLPPAVRDIVKNSYQCFSISGVTEVNVQDKIAYLINIEDSKTWKTIKVVGDEMEVTQSFNKQ